MSCGGRVYINCLWGFNIIGEPAPTGMIHYLMGGAGLRDCGF